MMPSDVLEYDPASVASADVKARAERRLRTWLAALSPNTRDAYGNDLTLFATHVGARDSSSVPSSGRAICELITLAPPDALEVAENWQARMVRNGTVCGDDQSPDGRAQRRAPAPRQSWDRAG
jgi:hypothetical protein